MGFVIAYFREGDAVILGDEHDREQALKYLGLPHRDPKTSHYVSEQELRKRDEVGA